MQNASINEVDITMEKAPLIEFQKVTKRFDTRTILDQVDLKRQNPLSAVSMDL